MHHTTHAQYKELREILTRLLSDAIDHTTTKTRLICSASNDHENEKPANDCVRRGVWLNFCTPQNAQNEAAITVCDDKSPAKKCAKPLKNEQKTRRN